MKIAYKGHITREKKFEFDTQESWASKEACLEYLEKCRSYKPEDDYYCKEILVEDKYVVEGIFENDAAIEWGGVRVGDFDLINFADTHVDRKVRVTIEFLD